MASVGTAFPGSTGYDLQAIRADFPMLERRIGGRPFVYLDNGATSLKPNAVIDAITSYYRDLSVNIHRGIYRFSEEASELYDLTRQKVAAFISCPPDGTVILTHGATESANLIAYSWMGGLEPGQNIVISDVEHHANFVPWKVMAERRGVEVRYLPIDSADGTIPPDRVGEVVDQNTAMVAVTAMSNVTGAISPLPEIRDAARRVGAIFVVDAAQYASHHPLNVAELDCDFLFFSAHKMLGPTGVGVLYGKTALLSDMEPFLYGGDMIDEVHRGGITFQPPPTRFEAGTPNISGVIGFGAAIDYLQRIGLEHVAAHERALLDYTLERAAAIPGLHSFGPTDTSKRGGIFSFTVEGLHPHDIGSVLDQLGIAVRTGFHCAMPLMDVFRVNGTTRASFYLYNTAADVDRLIDGLVQVQSLFG